MSGMKMRHSALLLSAALALPSMAGAQEVARFSVDTSALVGYYNNPFNLPGTDTSSGNAEIRVSPSVRVQRANSAISLTGNVDYRKYFRLYGDNFQYDVGGDYSGSFSVRAKGGLSVRYSSALVGQNGATLAAIDPSQLPPPATTGADLGLIGTRDRTKRLGFKGNFAYAFSTTTTGGLNANYDRVRYDRNARSGYDGYGATFGVQRQVSQHLGLGLTGTVSRYDSLTPANSATVYSPQVSFTSALSPYWKVDGAAGVTFVRRQTALAGAPPNSSGFSGNIDLCRVTSRVSFCLLAQRSAMPTGSGETQLQTQVSSTYSYKVAQHSSVNASLSYDRTDAGTLLPGSNNVRDWIRGSLGYQHSLSERVQLTVTSRYAHVNGGLTPVESDYGAQVGITAKFGRAQ